VQFCRGLSEGRRLFDGAVAAEKQTRINGARRSFGAALTLNCRYLARQREPLTGHLPIPDILCRNCVNLGVALGRRFVKVSQL
jgi:hypothetical protein